MIPKPNINLEVGSGTHGKMTGEMLIRIEEVLLQQKPDWVLVYGDTNSTLAGALAASKLHIPVAHIEAGLRSFNMKMPEEQNRILSDHVSTMLFCPTDKAVENLKNEGITKGVHKVGDIMYDAHLFYRKKLKERKKSQRIFNRFDLPEKYFLLTMHRAENTDDPIRFRNILEALNNSGKKGVFPMHPRTKKAMNKNDLSFNENIVCIDPVGYLDMLELEEKCNFIVTDSGGVQKEAYFFGKPCITLRDETEWIETVEVGANVVVGAKFKKILKAIANPPVRIHGQLYGNGKSGMKIIEEIDKILA
jgi:UDP-GlcNAc3NAcA epimerase